MKNIAKTSVFDSLVVYYFSGTGNALRASEWISEAAEKYNMVIHLHSIDRFDKIIPPELKDKTLIAFCYPTHGFNPAPLMLNFIVKFPRGKSSIVLINTRGGLKFRNVYFPGISGLAQLLPMLILFLKGYKIRGSLPFDMPSNWISIHPGLTDSAVKDIIKRRREQIFRFAERLLEKGRAFSYKFFVYMPLDIFVVPITVGYYFCGRYILAKSFFASADCNDCRICVDNCPTQSIRLINNRPYWKYTCESCMRCIGICPKKSIQTAHSFVITMIYLFSLIPVTAAAVNILDLKSSGILQDIIVRVINWIAVFIFMVAGYFIFSQMLRIKIVNRIFEYTSFTRYWKRYIVPEIKPKDFHFK
ncbi:MAG: EFR1 family ferrodoxin [Ignavibacteria bacterium]